MYDVYAELEARGLLYQTTDPERLRALFSEGPQTFYVGFDPTAETLHVGNLVPIMAMRVLQRAGHFPVALVGGGTAMVGDPSGKTEARRLLGVADIERNAKGIAAQLSRFVDLSEGRGKMVNNADWLSGLEYIPFLRDIGKHFSVNRMLSAESYKIRLETGLTFLEFNYMLLQAYDFDYLSSHHDCHIQIGGQDQWGNIVAGIDLIRRRRQRDAFGLTLPLLMNSSGEKFGKSVAGAVWLDATRLSVFDYYQFWRNTEDADVAKCLKIFTDLPVEECQRLGSLQAPLINRAKEILAFEATCLAHGEQAASGAFLAARSNYGDPDPGRTVETSSRIREYGQAGESAASLQEYAITAADWKSGIPVIDLLTLAGLCSSKGEARRLIRGGGAKLDDRTLSDEAEVVPGVVSEFVLKAGKKRIVRVRLT